MAWSVGTVNDIAGFINTEKTFDCGLMFLSARSDSPAIARPRSKSKVVNVAPF